MYFILKQRKGFASFIPFAHFTSCSLFVPGKGQRKGTLHSPDEGNREKGTFYNYILGMETLILKDN